MKRLHFLLMAIMLVALVACASDQSRPDLPAPQETTPDQLPQEQAEIPNATVDSSDIGISQEDLDKLKADIEGIQAEDLESLS